MELKETLAHLDDQWVENKLRMVQETADLRQIVLASEVGTVVLYLAYHH